MRSITLPDLSLLAPLTGLRALALKLGGTTNLDLLPSVGDIRYMELWMVRGLSDISVIGAMPQLRNLFLQALKNVQALPNFGEETQLRGVWLETMNGLKDLSPLGRTPMLEQLLIFDMPHLQPDDLRFLVGHRCLTQLSTALGSKRKYEAVTAMFDLPRVSSSKADWIAEAVELTE
ncbi:MAG: hypothetical protein ACYC1D_15785 [Acidimicrobiales bacterium]